MVDFAPNKQTNKQTDNNLKASALPKTIERSEYAKEDILTIFKGSGELGNIKEDLKLRASVGNKEDFQKALQSPEVKEAFTSHLKLCNLTKGAATEFSKTMKEIGYSQDDINKMIEKSK